MPLRQLPATGSDRDELARHLKRVDVWKLALLVAWGQLSQGEFYERLRNLRIRITEGQESQLLALALEEAKTVGL